MITDALLALIVACAPSVDPLTMHAVVAVESGGNPFAIGVVGGRLHHQPSDIGSAVATMNALEAQGVDYSIGLAQINRQHFGRLGWTGADGFDACANLAAGATILERCYQRAAEGTAQTQQALQRALSCYYSGSMTRGLRPDVDGGSSYVDRVRRQAASIEQQATRHSGLRHPAASFGD